MSKKKDKHLRRIDTNNTAGWQAVVVRNHVQHTKLFSDSLHGGKYKAKKKAKEYADKLAERLGPPLFHQRKGYFNKPTIRSVTNICGVIYKERSRNGIVTAYFQAQWYPEKYKPKTKSFSIERYGYDKALKLATTERKKGEREARINRESINEKRR